MRRMRSRRIVSRRRRSSASVGGFGFLVEQLEISKARDDLSFLTKLLWQQRRLKKTWRDSGGSSVCAVTLNEKGVSEFVSGFHKRNKKEEGTGSIANIAVALENGKKKTEQLVHLVLWLVKTVCLEE
ncbi:hypothetical protein ACLB2K_071699 [Fragaria x ananassa]